MAARRFVLAVLLALPPGCGGSPSQAPADAAAGMGGGAGGQDVAPPADAAATEIAGDATGAGGASAPVVVETLDVADVWSGHPVAFALITRGNQQLAAYFDANRMMSVAQRTLGATTWTTATLPTMLGWDSHNYVTMAVDADGFIHVSGNMHNVRLNYFRSTRAMDVTSLVQVTAMVGSNETSATYPQFFQGPSGDLVFAYRDGGSGNGNYIFNRYDRASRTWTRLLASPLIDGQGLRSAYPVGPILGPDGWYHLVWTWRDTPDASTNHDLSYARSPDLVHWQTAGGTALALPITFATSDIVDPVPVNGGMINNNTKIGFEAEGRAVVAYHKFDAAGNTQLYNARFENGAWVPHQTSMDWTYRWAFGGNGTLVFEIQIDEVKLQRNGQLTQSWYHAHQGGFGAFLVDPVTLGAIADIPPPLPYPAALEALESATPGMVVRWASDGGAGPDARLLYMLRWETLESNQDMPRPMPYPPPSRLRLYGIRQPQ